MNIGEAKFILQGFRPNGSDANDTTFLAALELTKHDATLRAWFERELAFDRAISAKLSQVQVPGGLREAILAGGRVTAPVTEPRRWWLRPASLAMAAGFALLFAVGVALRPKQTAASPTFTDFIINDARQEKSHHGKGAAAATFQAELARPTSHLGGPVGLDFDKLRSTGCRTVTFRGRDVLEVCFNRNGQWFHCYVVKAADFPSLVTSSTPTITDRGRVSLASWVAAGNVFVVVSQAGRDQLRQLL